MEFCKSLTTVIFSFLLLLLSWCQRAISRFWLMMKWRWQHQASIFSICQLQSTNPRFVCMTSMLLIHTWFILCSESWGDMTQKEGNFLVSFFSFFWVVQLLKNYGIWVDLLQLDKKLFTTFFSQGHFAEVPSFATQVINPRFMSIVSFALLLLK